MRCLTSPLITIYVDLLIGGDVECNTTTSEVYSSISKTIIESPPIVAIYGVYDHKP